MGVKDFFKIFPYCTIKDPKELVGLRIGVDVSYDIYRASLGMKSINGLTDTHGNPTVFLNVLLYNVAKYKQLGVLGIIYIFDHPEPNPLKLKENAKRRDTKIKAKDEIKKIKETKKDDNTTIAKNKTNQLEKRTFSITKEMIDDIKKFLNFLKIPWVVTPKNYEAEHLGAELMKQGIIDTLITSDSDTIMFGGKSMMRKVKKGTKIKYEEYRMQTILNETKLEHSDLVKAGVLMGNDFNEKTKGIGARTVLKKLNSTKLTKEQEIAYTYFMTKCPFDIKDIHRADKIDLQSLIKWMVNEKNFNEKRVLLAIKPFE